MKLRVLVNPKAGAGVASRKIPEISRALDQADLPHDVRETRGPGDARRLLDQARMEGVTCVAVVGGDGTINEVSQAYIDREGNPVPGPELALVPAGTGGDFRKTFGLTDGVAEAVQRIRDAAPRPLDLGVLHLIADDGAPVVRAFLNITSFGIGGLTDRIVNNTPKWMGGRAAFYTGTLRAMVAYRNAPVRVLVDGEPFHEGPIFNVAIANGRFFGGGMQIAPDADPSDGLFDVVVLGDLNPLETLGLSSAIYQGKHLGRNKVHFIRGARVEAEPLRSRSPVLIDMDGETPGRLALSANIAKGALTIRA
ncbi:MAG: diacylglycerol kinase family lipid kinase [Myxococcales bacterium]|nr:diacylglycerol kinase family lipid kinase [Myxococcales bacterium]